MKRTSPLDGLEAILAADRPRGMASLRKALASKKHESIVEAVQRAGELKVRELEPELCAIFDHFAGDGAEDDKRCAAKTAVVKTLHQLGCDRSEVFQRGVRIFQPAGPGSDEAAPLRIASALALAEFGHADAAEIMLDLLADPIADVRITAVRCLVAVVPHQAYLLLRLKVQLGDPSAPVIEECFSSLLATDSRRAIPFVTRHLKSKNDDTRTSAAIALGESRQQKAFEALSARWKQELDEDFRTTLLHAIAMLRQDYATGFLLAQIEEGNADALLALAPYSSIDSIRQEVEAAVSKTEKKELKELFSRKFHK
jgi:HEAT repeat protein